MATSIFSLIDRQLGETSYRHPGAFKDLRHPDRDGCFVVAGRLAYHAHQPYCSIALRPSDWTRDRAPCHYFQYMMKDVIMYLDVPKCEPAAHRAAALEEELRDEVGK